MASVRSIGRSNQYHHHSPAAEMPRTQSGREPLAIYARKLALKPRLQILRRYRRSLLLRLEYAPRSPMEDHVHRTMPVGTSVLINKTWYKLANDRASGFYVEGTDSNKGVEGLRKNIGKARRVFGTK